MPDKRLSPTRFALGVAACAAAVGAFAILRLRAYPPHEDEVLALFVGRDSLGGLAETVLAERGGAPLHFLVAWVVAHAGGGLTALRLASALFAVAAIPVVAALGARLADRRAGLAAAALAAGTWVFLFHAVFGRMYSLFLLVAAASYLALVARRFVLWAVLAVATVATHPYGALALASQLAFLGLTRERRALVPAVAAVVAAAPLWWSYATLAGRLELGSGESAKSTLGFLREAGGDLTSGYPLALGLFTVLAVAGLVRLAVSRPRSALLAATVAAAALAGVALAEVGGGGSPESRHLLFALPFTSLLVVSALPRRGVLTALLLAVLVALEVAWAWERTPLLFEGEPPARVEARRAAADWLARTSTPDDVLHGFHPLFLAAWERRGTDFPRTVIPRADAELALDELREASLGRGVWVLEGGASLPAGLESRRFGPFLVVRSRERTEEPARYLDLAERVFESAKGGDAAVNLETVRRARAALDG